MDSINKSSIIAISLNDVSISDDITILNNMSSSNAVTINLNNYSMNTSSYTYSSGAVETITLGNTDINAYDVWNITEEITPFENGFPAWKDFQEMCKEYPGLDKTFEHLKVFYNLCRSEWEAKKRGDA